MNGETLATSEQEARAKWDLLLADLELKQEQLRLARQWERPKAIAMIALAFAAIIASSRIADRLFPPAAQVITVHLDTPLFAPQPKP
jgi:hypothetical protein